MTADLSALIARLEAAEAGSHELDKVVAVACGSTINVWAETAADGTFLGSVRPVTTSLDAAIALAERVLPGWAVEVSRINAGTSRCTANIWMPSQRGAQLGSGRVFVDASTPALALCIATLRAKLDVYEAEGEVNKTPKAQER